MKVVLEDNSFEAAPGKQVMWYVEDDQTSAYVINRVTYPLSKKLNPIWWVQNLAEPSPPDWYKPNQNQKWRYVSWYCRNPLQNMGRYVLGVCDRNYSIRGTSPVLATMFSDANINKTGWKWSIISLTWLRLPFICYESDQFTFYIGWQWWGFFGIKLVFNKTPTIF